MTFMVPCDCDLEPTTCSLDGAAAALFRRQSWAKGWQIYEHGQASQCRQRGSLSQDSGEFENYALLTTLGSGDAQFAGDSAWELQVVLRMFAYTEASDPGSGMEFVQAAQTALMTNNLTFVGGIACLDRPSLPQQFDDEECTMITQGLWNMTTVLLTGGFTNA